VDGVRVVRERLQVGVAMGRVEGCAGAQVRGKGGLVSGALQELMAIHVEGQWQA
jgi:hypothetical protein